MAVCQTSGAVSPCWRSSEGTEGLEFQHFSSRVRSSPERAELESFHDYCFSLVISFIILLLQLSLC